MSWDQPSRILAALCAAALISLAPAPAHATPQPAPAGEPIAEFAVNDPNSIQTFGYVLWGKILGTVVDQDSKGNASINYGALGIQGREALNSFVTEMTDMPVKTLNKDEQLAYWLNLYNAAWLRIMFDQFTGLGKSGQELASKNPWSESQKFNIKRLYTADNNPWTVRNLTVDGIALSLNDIEHRILYAHWKPELVVYGLSCPLRGCPALSKQAFHGAQVQAQLRAAAEAFIADTDNVRVKGTGVQLSELYQWNQAAFGGAANLLEHIRQNAGPRKAELQAVTQVSGYDFDWKLAGKEPPKEIKSIQGQMNRGAGTGGHFQE
jgi:hypothetical protein